MTDETIDENVIFLLGSSDEQTYGKIEQICSNLVKIPIEEWNLKEGFRIDPDSPWSDRKKYFATLKAIHNNIPCNVGTAYVSSKGTGNSNRVLRLVMSFPGNLDCVYMEKSDLRNMKIKQKCGKSDHSKVLESLFVDVRNGCLDKHEANEGLRRAEELKLGQCLLDKIVGNYRTLTIPN